MLEPEEDVAAGLGMRNTQIAEPGQLETRLDLCLCWTAPSLMSSLRLPTLPSLPVLKLSLEA